MNKIIAVIQARSNSSRLPNKIFEKVGDYSLIQRVINGLKDCKNIDNIIVATTINQCDNDLVSFCDSINVLSFRGSELNVLERYYQCANRYKAKTIIRITADDPFKDPRIIDQMLTIFKTKKLDFMCNNNPPTLPEGSDVEIFSYDTLKEMFLNADNDYQKEHVTQYFHHNKGKFKYINYQWIEDVSRYRLTIDTHLDLEFCNKLCLLIPDLSKKNISIKRIVDYLKENEQFALSIIGKERSTMYNKL